MNKFARLDLGLKALLGRKTTVTAETSVQLSQLDWDNFSPSEEEQAIWEEMAFGAPVTQFRCGKCKEEGNFHWCHNHECKSETCACGKGMEAGAAVCETCLEESEFITPAVCKGCGKPDFKELLDFCRTCETNGTEWKLRGGNDTGMADTETDMNLDNDWDEDESQYEIKECPCGDEGCRHCNPL